MLVGRDRELARIDEALAPDSPEGQVLALLGDAGVGKTALLHVAAAHARTQGRQVLRCQGSPAETGLPYAVLHQLLGSARIRAAVLPDPQQNALRTAFGMEPAEAPPEPMLLRLAVLTLLSQLADSAPVLLVIDDMHWADAASVDVLAFIARRLEGEPVSLLAAARGTRLPHLLTQALPTLLVPPLTQQDSTALLQQRADLPPALRDRVLEQANGNPLALIELSRTAGDSRATAAVSDKSVPVTQRLEETFAAQLGPLPEITRQALLTAAAAATTDLNVICTALDDSVHTRFEIWQPAEDAELVTIHDGRVEFRHPLIASAVYSAAPFNARRHAHQRLSRTEKDPDRRAEHLFAAAVAPDEESAAEVEAAAERRRLRGALNEAVDGFERAAQLSPDPAQQGRRLGIAAVVAMVAGDVTRAEHLAQRAGDLAADPAGRAWVSELAAIAASLTLRMEQGFYQLLPSVEEMAPRDEMVFYSLTVAAHIAYYSGRSDFQAQLAHVLAAVPPSDAPTTIFRERVRWTIDPHRYAATARAQLPTAITALHGEPSEQHAVAGLAMHLDATDTAITLLDAIAHPDRPDSTVLQGGLAAADRAWALFDAGRWAEARQGATSVTGDLTQPPALLSHLSSRLLLGTLAAATGQPDQAKTLLRTVIDQSHAAHIQAIAVRAQWACALTPLADNDFDAAYALLRPLFDRSGAPAHFHVSCYYVPDLALAAVRTGRGYEAATVLDRVRNLLGDGASPRIRQLLHRAEAHVHSGDQAEASFLAALNEPQAPQWAFEHAMVQLDYGQWLRRQRRVGDARLQLTAALNVFDRLGALPWADRVREELRASGITAAPPQRDALLGFSPRTRQILQLAAEGLTNPQIGERLYLSPRTVSSHLYRSFPKLGIAHRSKLRDVINSGNIPTDRPPTPQ